jgi:hypothetical protein
VHDPGRRVASSEPLEAVAAEAADREVVRSRLRDLLAGKVPLVAAAPWGSGPRGRGSGGRWERVGERGGVTPSVW